MDTDEILATTVKTLQATHAATDKLIAELESLRRLRKLIEDQVDTVDGPDGEPLGNAASQIISEWRFREWADHGRRVSRDFKHELAEHIDVLMHVHQEMDAGLASDALSEVIKKLQVFARGKP